MRKKLKKYVPWIILGFVAVVLALMPAMARKAATEAEADILSATATTGVIENTLAGGGTLTADAAEEVTIPSTVEISEFLIENGDHVVEGQPLATIDRVTLLGAMVEVQKSLDEIALEMQQKANIYSTTKLTAQASGRIKAIYAEIGDDAKNVVLKHGALAVVSLDGMMVTEIQTAVPIRPGEALTIRLASGKEVPGRVETALDGKLTITISDDGPLLGEQVTAYTVSGEEVGKGTLSVHNAWNLLATDGTVNYIYVRENQPIFLGGAIVSVDELSGSAEYEALAAKHRKYEELLREMFGCYTDDTIKAPATGFVNNIDEELIKNTAVWDKEYRITLLADETSFVTLLVTSVNGTAVTGISVSSELDLSSLTALLTLLNTGNEPSINITEGNVPAVGDIIKAEIDSDRNAVAVETINHIDISGLLTDAENAAGQTSDKAANGINTPTGLPDLSGLDLSGLMSGGMSAFGGFGISLPTEGSSAEEEQDTLYSLEETTILSIVPDNAMTVSIRVDELDILQYEIGMTADVTVDALPDQHFSAEVIEIGALGENTGGNSKYTVKLRLDRAPDMLEGMNASVVVHRGSRSALLLPVAAVYDRGSKSFVYGATDSKTGKPKEALPVTTGLSDGEWVEILDGIAEGQTVYYEYYVPDKKQL